MQAYEDLTKQKNKSQVVFEKKFQRKKKPKECTRKSENGTRTTKSSNSTLTNRKRLMQES